MKIYRKILTALATVLTAAAMTGCLDDQLKEKDSLDLDRCLQPMNLSAKVSSSLGDVVTFSWDVSKDAESYNFVVYSDESMTNEYINESLEPSQVPYTIKMEADSDFWFKVQAISSSRKESKWAEYGKKIETFAVKDPLFLKVESREANALTFKWSTDVTDYKEVSHVAYAVTGSGDFTEVNLSDDEIDAASVTITGLTPSTEYDVILYFKSASRGEVDVWTMPDTSGTTEVSTTAALEQSIKDGANIFLKMEGSPYTLGGGEDNKFDTSKGFKIYGEESADGTKPVINGAVGIAQDFDGGDIYFEGVEFNGINGTLGHPISLKNGGTGSLVPINSIIYKNCTLTGYSKGLIYEWNQTFNLGELTWDSCYINLINGDGQGGGDGIDFRGKSECDVLNIVNNTITTGFRTFLRIDAGVWGKINVNQNTLMDLCFTDNTNNAGLIAINKDNGTTVAELTLKNNLILNMQEKATLGSANAKYYKASELSVAAADNWYYSVPETFFTESYPATGFTALEADPCYNAKGGLFNINADSEIAGKEIGASKWWISYVEEPEDLTLPLVEGAKTWNLANAKYFSGTVKKSMVRDQLMIVASENNPVSFADGVLNFSNATVCNKKGVPQDGYIVFKVDKPGSVVIKPVGGDTFHAIVGVGPVSGGTVTVKGGASTIVDADNPQKIIISDITEESLVYVYVSGGIGIGQLAWSNDVSQVNRALPAPAPKATPDSFTAGEATDITVTWDAVENAGSYSVVFRGKTYAVEDGETQYVIEGKTTSMLDAGSYTVEVYANPDKNDIYNTASNAGTAAFAVLPQGGSGGETELVVKSVQELNDAIAAGKTDITLAYNTTPYELGTLALTAPLRLKGQASGDSYPTVNGAITLSGEIGGSVTFTNINFDGTGISESVIKEADVVTADTVAVIGGTIKNYSKALYDNSGKKVSSVQYLIFDNIQVYDCSTGSDFIDMRAGAYHNLQVTRSTFARSARTFIRTDAASEVNNVLVRNNTFYEVCTNSTSKDNNGLFHIRSTAGSGIQQYKIQNNLFYSILINEAPGNANGYPKFISKNAAAIKPAAIMNNYFYNIQEDGDYSWWTVNCSKEEGIAGGGAILPADPCKDAKNYDFTLTNGVAINAGIGDPRWNPAGGGTPSSEITVDNANDFLTAISAGKKTITLSAGTYDLTAITEAEGLTGGVLSITGDLSLIGSGSVTFIGGFKPVGTDINKFSATGISFDGANTVSNFFEIADKTVNMASVSIKNGSVSTFKNRLFSQSVEASVASLAIDGILSNDMGTGGDYIDVRKGTLSSIKVTNSTFANGIRTFLRVDAAAICSAITVKNNTFYNLCAVDNKDNNGIMHVRSTTLSANPAACKVESNIFAFMHRAETAPAQANGFPKLVSTSSQKIFEPTFSHNYYYDIDTDAGYSWWNTLTGGQEGGCAGYGVVLTATPFQDAANGDFTLTDPLVMSENIGDPRWNSSKGGRPDDAFAVSSVEDMLTAISAGKTNLSLAYGTYDFTTATSESITAGALTVGSSLTLTGKAKNGKYPEIIGAFKLTGTSATSSDIFTLSNLTLNGNSTLGNMIDIDPSAKLGNVTLRNCEVTAYQNRLVSQSGTSTIGSLDISGLLVKDMGTSGDFIDFRKGSVVMVSVTNSTFYNGIRTFLRVDAAVNCGSIKVKNNTFYNICAVDSKDNNGIMHVRSSSLAADKVKVEKNIFAAMHRAEATPAQANGFPKLVSTSSQKIFEPTFIGNIFFDFDTDAGYSWWNTLSNGETTGTADGGQVLTETPFSGDPTTGKFTVKAAYKGYGDTRW